MSNVGLTVVEGVANGTAPFVDPSKRNIGLLMERERGVEGVPVKFVSQDEDSRIFGGEFTNTYGSFVVRTLFENAKGIPTTIYGVRVVGAGSVAASLTKVIATKSVVIKAGRKGKEDKGTWGNSIKCILYGYGLKNRNAFTLEVYYKGKLVDTFYDSTCALLQAQINSVSDHIVITFSGEIPQAISVTTPGTGHWSVQTAINKVVGVGTLFTTEAAVGDVLMNGTYFAAGEIKSIEDATHLTLQPASPEYPYADYYYGYADVAFTEVTNSFAEEFQLAGGTYVAPTEQNFYPAAPGSPVAAGLSFFDNVDVQLIAVTENATLTMAQQGEAYCRGRGDATYLYTMPLNSSDAMAEIFANALQTSGKSYAAGYNIWASILDAAGNSIVIPAIGQVLGAGYLRTPFVQGDYAHIPPAGTDSVFLGVLECFPTSVDKPRLNRLTRDFTVNSAVFKEGTGYYIATSRTMSTNSLCLL